MLAKREMCMVQVLLEQGACGGWISGGNIHFQQEEVLCSLRQRVGAKDGPHADEVGGIVG